MSVRSFPDKALKINKSAILNMKVRTVNAASSSVQPSPVSPQRKKQKCHACVLAQLQGRKSCLDHYNLNARRNRRWQAAHYLQKYFGADGTSFLEFTRTIADEWGDDYPFIRYCTRAFFGNSITHPRVFTQLLRDAIHKKRETPPERPGANTQRIMRKQVWPELLSKRVIVKRTTLDRETSLLLRTSLLSLLRSESSRNGHEIAIVDCESAPFMRAEKPLVARSDAGAMVRSTAFEERAWRAQETRRRALLLIARLNILIDE